MAIKDDYIKIRVSKEQKALFKDSVKEIKNTYKRFLSILLMAFLGVGFFAGIRATSPDMVDTIDDYYNSHNMYDIQIISTLGLTNDDIEEISSRNQELKIAAAKIISKINNCNLNEMLFVDDIKENIISFNKEGINAVLPDDVGSLIYNES